MSKKSKPASGALPVNERYQQLLVLLLITVVTWIVYFPILSNGFINWDDPTLILMNPDIQSLGFSQIRHLFSSFYLGNYHPLTMMVFSFEYALFGTSASGYHAVSLILHTLNASLVFYLVFSLAGRKIIPASIAGIFFALHPMFLESVAWATELKDTLYTFFYLIAVHLYLKYRKNPADRKFLVFSLFSFLLSLLSKGQAVTLPLTLILIDYLLEKKVTLKSVTAKIPYLALSLIFGLVAIYAQQTHSGINETRMPVADLFFMNCYAYLLYLGRSVFPLGLSGFHEYPCLADGSLPFYVWLSPVVIILLAFLVIRFFRKKERIIFGILFFTLNILPLLLIPVGKAWAGERFTYIPYIGLFFIIATLAEYPEGLFSRGKNRNYFIIGCTILALIFGITTHARTAIWKNSITYWNDVSSNYPRSMLAYEHKSMYYTWEVDSTDSAIRELREAIRQDSNYATGYRLLGFLMIRTGDPASALGYLEHGLRLEPRNVDMLFYRGNAYRDLSRFGEALTEYNRVLGMDRSKPEIWSARGSLYVTRFSMYDSAIADFRQAAGLNPAEGTYCLNAALACYHGAKYDSAISWSARAIGLGKPLGYYIRAASYYKLGDFSAASREAQLARQNGVNTPDSLMKKQ